MLAEEITTFSGFNSQPNRRKKKVSPFTKVCSNFQSLPRFCIGTTQRGFMIGLEQTAVQTVEPRRPQRPND